MVFIIFFNNLSLVFFYFQRVYSGVFFIQFLFIKIVAANLLLWNLYGSFIAVTTLIVIRFDIFLVRNVLAEQVKNIDSFKAMAFL